VTLREAQALIAAAIAKAESEGGNAMSIAVVDEAGFLVMLARMDDAHVLSAQIAEAKASGSAMWHRTGDELAEIHAKKPHIFERVDRLSRVPLMPSGGSLLIRRGGRVVGAVGISAAPGGRDNECAQAGLDALSGPNP
jgi:uncharacterized protein GlcG (DUF336 family)